MKKIIAIILCSVFLTGCKNIESIPDDGSDASMFKRIERTLNYTVVYHRKTKVMYAVSYGTYNKGTFTLLVNADGTPMIYEGEE